MPTLKDDDRVVGTGGYILWEDENADTPEEIKVPITHWSIRSQGAFQDLTTSEQYDDETELLYPKQIQVAVSTEGAISGRFRLGTVPSTFVAAMYSGKISPKMTFYLTEDRKFGDGRFNVSDFDAEMPHDGVVTFTCRIIGYGKFSPDTSEYTPPAKP